MDYSLLIRGGEVVDPSSGNVGAFDVGIKDGRIAAVEPSIPVDSADEVIDASGKLVTPGLVDLHTHVFRGVGYFGIDPDSISARSGVTTWIDAGSAGAFSLPGLREYVVDRTKVRVLALMNISYLGAAGLNYDEYCNLDACDVDLFERVAGLNRDLVLGIKVRMGTGKVGNQGLEPLKRAVEAAQRCNIPMMVHIATAPPAIEDVLAHMRPGDILTHAFTGQSQRLVDDDGNVRPAAREAQKSGVIIDLGHGSGSFSFSSAEKLTAGGIWPDVISTDLHQVSLPGPNLLAARAQETVARVRGDGEPKFTMLTVMTKMLHLGMALPDVVAAASANAAKAVRLDDGTGTLAPGARADVAVLELVEGDFELFDVEGLHRRTDRQFRHVATFLGGERLEDVAMPPMPPWVKLVDVEGDS